MRKFGATGSVLDAARPGRSRSVNTEEARAGLTEVLVRSPQKSSRRLSSELSVSHVAVWHMLKELNYRPFRPRLIHALHDGDADRRVEFCELFLDLVDADRLNGQRGHI